MERVLEWFKRDKAPRAQLACAALVTMIEEHLRSHDLRAICAGLTFLVALWPRIVTSPSQDGVNMNTTHDTRHTTRMTPSRSTQTLMRTAGPVWCNARFKSWTLMDSPTRYNTNLILLYLIDIIINKY
jgi:hypothetical protein